MKLKGFAVVSFIIVSILLLTTSLTYYVYQVKKKYVSVVPQLQNSTSTLQDSVDVEKIEKLCNLASRGSGIQSLHLCLIAFARDSNDYRICEKINVKKSLNGYEDELAEESQLTCFAQVSSLDVEASSIDCPSTLPSRDLSFCLAKKAIKSRAVHICDNISVARYKDLCYLGFSEVLKKNEAVCKNIINEEHRNNCLSVVFCTNLLNDEELIKKDAESETLCREMLSENNTTNTKNLITSFSAAAKEASVEIKESDCSGWPSQDLCYQMLAEQTGDVLFCQKIKLDSTSDDCYESLAVAKKDVSLCEKMQDIPNGRREKCYVHMAYILGNESICEQIYRKETPPYKGYCFNTHEICQKSYDEEVQGYKDICYGHVAVTKTDLQLCKNISGNTLRDQCYFDVAQDIAESSICNNISNETYKIKCSEDILRYFNYDKFFIGTSSPQ